MKKITLSFDNGPDPEITPYVLDVLARHEIRTTFFVVGEKLRDPARRRLCERARADGHWIGNHTFNHLTPLGRSQYPEAYRLEIARTQELIGELAHPHKFFRPFGGGGNLDDSLLDQPSLSHLLKERFTCILWNVVPRDWENPGGWVSTAVEQCRSEEWPLVVLHDLQTGAMSHLEEFLLEMQSDGAQFVQEFPDLCVPIARGEIVGEIRPFVSESRTTFQSRYSIRSCSPGSEAPTDERKLRGYPHVSPTTR
ncbi:polysaccharide deacetylase family protein [Aurantimonas sp. C2-6-R+9]|uniref:polysaccharide deacetylase family protein n=1 Tax=unclassified Aurantimonas TaxID=2638230 RepID=UPI002E18BFDB|nr:polysaccharide deacetylase family protein [Aurantimonas sp. C2-6-R+9]